jgi:hypothetical protein
MLEFCPKAAGEYLAIDTIADGELAFERVLGLIKELRDSNAVYAISTQSDWEEAVRSLGAVVGCGFLRLRTVIPIHRGQHSDDRGQSPIDGI